MTNGHKLFAKNDNHAVIELQFLSQFFSTDFLVQNILIGAKLYVKLKR